LPAAIWRCASERCGDYCSRLRPAQASCWPWMWRTWTRPTDGPGRTARGGAVEWMFWRTGSAQLLPRMLAGRTSGPVFLSGRRPTRAAAALGVDPISGRARLSYRRAAELFQAYTGWTLHRLRHSALTHAAADGTNLPLLLARSRHASVRSLERYARPGLEAVAHHLAQHDRARRRPLPSGPPWARMAQLRQSGLARGEARRGMVVTSLLKQTSPQSAQPSSPADSGWRWAAYVLSDDVTRAFAAVKDLFQYSASQVEGSESVFSAISFFSRSRSEGDRMITSSPSTYTVTCRFRCCCC
jgi:hypothetical protein